MTNIVCRHCGNLVGQTDGTHVEMLIKVRGSRRRLYRVPAPITSLTCEACDRDDQPVTHGEFQRIREADADAGRLQRIGAGRADLALAGVNT